MRHEPGRPTSEEGSSVSRREKLTPFRQKVSEGLGKIFKELSELHILNQHTLPSKDIDRIEEELKQLMAGADLKHLTQEDNESEGALAYALETIALEFDLLNTVGIANNERRFDENAAHALKLVKVALLTLGGPTAQKYVNSRELWRP